jgi:hypothetical protein
MPYSHNYPYELTNSSAQLGCLSGDFPRGRGGKVRNAYKPHQVPMGWHPQPFRVFANVLCAPQLSIIHLMRHSKLWNINSLRCVPLGCIWILAVAHNILCSGPNLVGLSDASAAWCKPN